MGKERLELVVGDEAPYQVLARLGVKNTITTGGKFRLCENRKLTDRDPDGDPATEPGRRQRDSDPDRDPATPDGDSKKIFS